jgi:hypothetical protein
MSVNISRLGTFSWRSDDISFHRFDASRSYHYSSISAWRLLTGLYAARITNTGRITRHLSIMVFGHHRSPFGVPRIDEATAPDEETPRTAETDPDQLKPALNSVGLVAPSAALRYVPPGRTSSWVNRRYTGTFRGPGLRLRRQPRDGPRIQMQATASKICERPADRRSPPAYARPTRRPALRTLQS